MGTRISRNLQSDDGVGSTAKNSASTSQRFFDYGGAGQRKYVGKSSRFRAKRKTKREFLREII